MLGFKRTPLRKFLDPPLDCCTHSQAITLRRARLTYEARFPRGLCTGKGIYTDERAYPYFILTKLRLERW